MTNSAGRTSRHADVRNHLSLLALLGRIEFRIAFDKEGLLRRGAEERPRTPDVGQKSRHVAHDLLPERRRVGLEDDELHALINGLAQEEQRPADIDVLQIVVGIAAQRARAPDADVAVQITYAVDALRVQSVLLALC